MLLLLLILTLVPAPSDTVASGEGEVRAAAEAALARQFPEDAGRLDVRVVRTGGDVVTAGPLRVRFAAERGLPRAHTQVDVLAGSDAGGWHRAGWAMLYVAHFDSVVVARADVRRDGSVEPDALSAAWMETTRFPGEPLHPADARALATAGAVFAARPLRAGRPLNAGDLRTAYAAETGGSVTVHYRRGHVVLRLPGKAREPGFVGDAVRVYCPDTQSTYRVRLTAPGTAEWMETL